MILSARVWARPRPAEEADIVIWVDAPDVADDAADDMARDWRSAANNKSDVARLDDDGALRLSAKTGDGAEALLAALGRLVLQKTGSGEARR